MIDSFKTLTSPPVSSWDEDGKDHINIYEYGNTDIGRALCSGSDLGFKHSVFGYFRSMKAFWCYIHSVERDDRVRKMSKSSLVTFSKSFKRAKVVNFRAIIMDSTWQRICKYPVIKEAICNSKLPFDCYYILPKSGVRVRYSYTIWFNAGMEEIRKALLEKRDPDFSFLLDEPGTGIYQYAVPTQKVKKTDSSLGDLTLRAKFGQMDEDMDSQ
jgi:hypothetical protein